MISYKGGNGTSKQESIIILGASNEMEGVDAEHNFLNSKYGGYELVSQELMDEGYKQYDILRIKFRNGDVKEFWFEITDFYVK